MKFLTRIVAVFALAATLFSACAEREDQSYEVIETLALEAWITQNRPELIDNLQEDGGYYVDVVDAGDLNSKPINDTICWVRYDISGRDFGGNIIITRFAEQAMQMGTYSRKTHYVPTFSYVGDEYGSVNEGTFLAMRNSLKLGANYAASRGLPEELLMREGTELVLYMPSRIVGGEEGSGGYEGEYTLDPNKPYIATITVEGISKNPLEDEIEEVDAFCEGNGGLKVYNSVEDEAADDDATEINPIPTDPTDANHPYNIAERWTSACDSIPDLYVDLKYRPEHIYSFPNSYRSVYEPYNNFSQLEADIAAALVERFYPADDEDTEPYVGVKDLVADSVKLDGTAKIWYIGRFLDGFIFDTNIDEVKELVYGKVESIGTALSYTPETGSLVKAFYYTVPNLKFGQWATIITTSTYGYGYTGQSGTSSTSSSSGYSSDYYDYMNYTSYNNSMYGSSGYYDPYYSSMYGYGYDPYAYGYDTGYDTGTTTTTTTVSTEILPYAPLIFQIYIEPSEEEL